MQQPSTQQEKYFDLHITGIGYLNRVREVTPPRAQSFFAVDISAMHGNSDDIQYTRFDCKATGEKAKAFLERLQPHIEKEGNKVLIGFKLGDLYPEPFIYKSGKRVGETGISLKARLLRIDWVKVNGELIELESAQAAA